MSLKSLSGAVDRFCYDHPRFGIRGLMYYVIGGTGLVYLLGAMGASRLLDFLAFSPELILRGQVWRLVSFIFIPNSISISDFIWIALALYFYYFIGSALERQWGPGRFTVYYAFGILLDVVFGFLVYILGYRERYFGLTSYYINMSMFFAFACIYPDARVLLFFFIPVEVRILAYIDAAYFVLEIFLNMSSFPMNLMPLVAFANVLIFCGSYLTQNVLHARPLHQTRNAVNFRQAARRAVREEAQKPYHYKCAVCGRTDTDHPELEFRYCSRCAGYHCFCQDHINNHVHFKE